ncbi:MAG TPA: mechanosensitive ion channel family protein [Bryobacteraceae bacterium]|nr:mechanosensitive ion channel family protein [Bryobacteraceae bacterium]
MKGFDAQHWLGVHWQQLIVPICVLGFTLAIGYAAKRLMTRLLRPWAARGTGHAAQIVIDALKAPFMIWVLILGMHLAMQSSELPYRATSMVGRILLVLWILSLTIISSRLAGDLIRFYGRDIPGALPVTTLSQTLAQLGVVIFGVLVLLNLLGISVTPILTALGVGGLAVALALQDTLSNLFAGFYIAVARQVRLGDYIRLNTGEEGYVTDIGWRSTTVRSLAYSMIIIPNNKLGQAIVTNFYLPEKRVSVSIQIGVACDSDADQVERVLLEEAQAAAQEVPGMLADPAPTVSFDPGFGDWSLNFTVGYYVAEFANQFSARAALRKRILKRLRQEKIEMPFPTRTIYVRGPGGSA